MRTRDPLLPKQMRYQAALRSDSSYSNLPQTLFVACTANLRSKPCEILSEKKERGHGRPSDGK